MWIARLSWRSPPRCGRCRCVLPDDDRGGHDPAPWLLQQRRAVRFDQAFELCEQLALVTSDLTDLRHESSGDRELWAALQLAELPGEARKVGRVLDRGGPELRFDLRCDLAKGTAGTSRQVRVTGIGVDGWPVQGGRTIPFVA